MTQHNLSREDAIKRYALTILTAMIRVNFSTEDMVDRAIELATKLFDAKVK